MVDTKLSALPELATTPANDDEVYIRDVSEAAAQESKRITIANLLAGEAPTKEFFVPVTYGTDMGATDDHPGALIDTAGEVAYIEFMVPADFSSITSAIVVCIALGADQGVNYRMTLDIYTDYGALDEADNNHSEMSILPNAEGHITVNDLISFDILSVLSSLAPGDYVGVRLLYNSGQVFDKNETNARILGVRFKYS